MLMPARKRDLRLKRTVRSGLITPIMLMGINCHCIMMKNDSKMSISVDAAKNMEHSCGPTVKLRVCFLSPNRQREKLLRMTKRVCSLCKQHSD